MEAALMNRIALLEKLASARVVADQVAADVQSMIVLNNISDEMMADRLKLAYEGTLKLSKMLNELRQ